MSPVPAVIEVKLFDPGLAVVIVRPPPGLVIENESGDKSLIIPEPPEPGADP